MHKSRQNFFICQFFKKHVLWCSSDYGDQKQPNGPPKPQIFNTVTHILHTPTLQFFRYLHFSKPEFFDVLEKRSTIIFFYRGTKKKLKKSKTVCLGALLK